MKDLTYEVNAVYKHHTFATAGYELLKAERVRKG